MATASHPSAPNRASPSVASLCGFLMSNVMYSRRSITVLYGNSAPGSRAKRPRWSFVVRPRGPRVAASVMGPLPSPRRATTAGLATALRAGLRIQHSLAPRNPVPGEPALVPGQYVRIVRSLVSDDPHVRIHEEEADYTSENRAIHGILGGDDPTTLAVRLFWEQERLANNPFNGARWSELHPPDTVQVKTNAPQRDAHVLRSVLVAPPPNLASGQTFTFDYTLPLPLPPSTSASVVPTVTEIVGADARPRTLRGRSTAPPTRRVTVTTDSVHLRITVMRHGTSTTPSAFQATYLITPCHSLPVTRVRAARPGANSQRPHRARTSRHQTQRRRRPTTSRAAGSQQARPRCWRSTQHRYR